uniref:NADH-ubiquinone oxidoreductase chain 5 n=1 Tax=Seira pallidipes TaxID=3053390 RepID=A0AAU6QDK2_9HEXA
MLFFLGFFFMWKGLNFYLFQKVLFLEWEIFSLFSSSVIFTLLLDWMSLLFMSFVMLISSMVLIYSSYYMESDKFFNRFIILVFLFVLSMIFLIISPNLISILLGWDGLGLISYCLVIYYQNVKSSSAGMLTILSNRIGDVAILLAISWLMNYGSWNFFYLQYMYYKLDMFFIMFMVILAGMTKSAQIPFSAWLPAAMAAPTPVSALVHSSTLVTAGVYLLIRFNYLLDKNMFLFYLGSLTMFMSGLSANYEYDLKKIIALSTLSQLGVMMMILGLGCLEMSFFHLVCHAFFKSLLFLCAGVFIHNMGDIQDIRGLGGLNIGGPVSSFFFIACSLSLCGFPFMTGFYSKDMILEYIFMDSINFFMIFIVIVGTLFTVSYSLRLSYYLFFKGLGLKTFFSMSESKGMIYSMVILFIFSVMLGGLMSWLITPLFFVFLNFYWKLMILFFVFLTSYLMYELMKILKIKSLFLNVNLLIYYISLMWFMPYFSTLMFFPLLKIGFFLIKFFDQGWIEYLGGQGMNLLGVLKSSKVDYFYLMNLKTFMFIFFLMGAMMLMIF